MSPNQLPADWREILSAEIAKPYFTELRKFVDAERKAHTIYPPEKDVFNAFKATPFASVKVLLLGQDPYHGEGQAHGMCFSVRPGVRKPPSLVNMFKELHDDLGCKVPNHGCLQGWAERGVMLLNAVLTVRAGKAGSHAGKGWEEFTDAAIRALDAKSERVVFVLLGAYARKKRDLVTGTQHVVFEAGHPSPMNPRGFLGSRPFSAVNKALADAGLPEIDWTLDAPA
jgi:uracil-DNA glycosylase